ncbi:MAG: hypothetical protein UT17_C0003G0030 [Candidatus Woesebacteria bacterium GW2011_GWB1_39_10]|uniref:DUF4446 domain-containing protein n=2 Tax=Candidatus Woeseibacteriota TaxID=1752722 RepID=A0A0G0LLT9_9BACT|nr:MAG: hypothetical protein UT17_C0003G0030 [Candidatus Woesebacteria bacterium GW2011_GWB1_39_10]KKS90967.1 MAG: hypothetical protein UV66_C0001G0324 [Candidatus Woesebacteria bacterium GW2011_GWA1_43_12]
METQVFLFLTITAVWLLGISIILYKIFVIFNRLTKGVGVADLKKVLEKVISKEEENGIDVAKIIKRVSFLEEDGRRHVQKVFIVRFNPFRELGGDHSFSLAILDGEDTGIIITSLHTRDRTRVYMKDIKRGKSSFELSVDEKKALTGAQKSK